MGLNYSYDLIAHRSSAERLVRALADHLVPEQQARLLATLADGVAGVMDRFEREQNPTWLEGYGYEWPRDACLTFLFPEDAHIAAYSDEHPVGRPEPIDGRVPFGCVWTDVACGDAFVRVRATAATSSMSVLFYDSRSVRSVFVAIGEAGGAFLVAFDDESGEYLDALWPHEGRLALSEQAMAPAGVFSVDAYGAHLLDALREAFGGAPPDSGVQPPQTGTGRDREDA